MNTIFETERLIMREFTLDDTQEIYEYSQEESMKNHIPDQVYESVEQAREVLEFLMSKYSKNLDQVQYPYVLGVVMKETRQLIGHVGLSEIQEGIEVGYAIGEKYQRTGFGTEAVGALADWAKDTLKIPVIYAVVKDDNIGSCKAVEKAGFVFEKSEAREGFGKMYQRRIYTK